MPKRRALLLLGLILALYPVSYLFGDITRVL